MGKAEQEAARTVFLECYAETGSITKAAVAAGLSSRARHYDWLKASPEYAKQFAEAHEKAVDALESEARRRAVEGVPEPVFYKGVPCGVIRRYSDQLLIVLLKGSRPEKYRERHELTGKDGRPLVPPDLSRLSEKELDALEHVLVKLTGGEDADVTDKM